MSRNQSIQSRQLPGFTFRTSINTEVATFPLYYRYRGTARHSQGPAGSQYTSGHKISPQQPPQMVNRKENRERAERRCVAPRLSTADCPGDVTLCSSLTHAAVSRPKLMRSSSHNVGPCHITLHHASVTIRIFLG